MVENLAPSKNKYKENTRNKSFLELQTNISNGFLLKFKKYFNREKLAKNGYFLKS